MPAVQDTGAVPPAGPAPARKPDALSDPLPAGAAERAPERTPIFEEMESTWFGTRRAVQQQPAAPRPAEPAEPTGPAGPTGPAAGGGSPAPAPAARAETSPREPAASGSGTAADTGAGRWRPSPNDERWRQAEQVRQPSAGGVTTSGLPRRVPRANLVPGAAQPQRDDTPAGPRVSRAPADVRGRLTNLRRGIQQGRQAGSAAGRTDRDFGSTYQQ